MNSSPLNILKLQFFIVLFGSSVAIAQNNPDIVKQPDIVTHDENFFGRPLTDGEQDTVDNFQHDGLLNDTVLEECQKHKEACTGTEATVFGETGDALVGAISKMYALFSLSGVFKGKDFKSDDIVKDAEGNKEVKEGAEERTDYCQYIPTASETIAFATQTADQANIGVFDQVNNDNEPQQKKALLKVARMHKSRMKTAKVQTAGFGATTACYTWYTMTNGATSTSTWVKFGAAAALTAFYAAKTGKHEDYYKDVKGIADKLPGAGDCNPITDNDCYCSHPQTENDPEFCAPEALKAQAKLGPEILTTCVNDKLENDPSCLCARSDTCFDKVFSSSAGANFGSAFSSNKSNPVKSLSQGQLTSGQINSLVSGAAAARIKRPKKLGKAFSDNGLTPSQRSESLALQKRLGVDPAIANYAARQPITAATEKARKNLVAGLDAKSLKRTNNLIKRVGGKVLTFRGSNRNNRSKSSSKKLNNPFAKLGKKKANKEANGKILRFANRATAQAQISRNTDRPLFEIISRRYKVSGLKRLKLAE